jgi:hypothetical protein
MTHEEYVSRLEDFGDSPADVNAVLAHVSACAVCREEQRRAEKKLAALEPARPGRLEAVLRWAAAAAVVAVVAAGLRRPSEQPPAPAARYTIVGDASGVVAYTPGGIVVGTAGTPAQEVTR